jgi:hypothetical protein
LIAEGKANKETAAELGIGIKTVEKHREHLMQKLDIHDTAGLTRYAIGAGIIESSVQLTIVICWGVCFWWMRRLSVKQNFLLDQLREQGKRIENLSKIEHDLIKEVHPQVNEIKEGMEEMIAVVKENANPTLPESRKKRVWFSRRAAD